MARRLDLHLIEQGNDRFSARPKSAEQRMTKELARLCRVETRRIWSLDIDQFSISPMSHCCFAGKGNVRAVCFRSVRDDLAPAVDWLVPLARPV